MYVCINSVTILGLALDACSSCRQFVVHGVFVAFSRLSQLVAARSIVWRDFQ